MGLVAILQSIWAFLTSLFFFRAQQSSQLPTAIPLKPRNNGPPQTPRRQPPHEYCSLGPNQLGSWRAQKEQFMRNPSLIASPKQRRNASTTRQRPQDLIVLPPVFRLPSLTAVDDWNARVDGGTTYQISSLHPRQPLPAVIITPCTPEKKPSPPLSSSAASASVPSTPPTPKLTQPIFVNPAPGPEDDDEDIALKRVMEDLEYALNKEEDINPFDVSPSPTNSNPDPPSFNISQSLQISLSKQSPCPDDASWDIPWESLSSSGKYMTTSTPLLGWSAALQEQGQEHEKDPFTNPQNVVESPRAPPPHYTDLFDLDMYLEASLAIAGSLNLEEGESENPFEDTFAVEPITVVTVSLSEKAVPMNRLVKERDVYRPSGYTRSPRFRFSVDENGSPVPVSLRSPRRAGVRMTVVDRVRAVLDESGEEEEEEGEEEGDDTSEISMPALNARLREACRRRKSGADAGLGGHGSSQRKSGVPPKTGSPRASLGVVSIKGLAPHASLPALRPSSRLLRDITNTMTTSTSSSSTLASIAHTVQKNPFSLSQNPIDMTMQENPISTQNAIKLKTQIPTTSITRNPIARFGRDIANIVVDDSANSVNLCGGNAGTAGGENTTTGSVYTMASVYSGENTTGSTYSAQNTMGSAYSAQNTMGSVYAPTSMYTTTSAYAPTSAYTMTSTYAPTTSAYAPTTSAYAAGHNTTTYTDEASARALKARLRQACENFSKSVWVDECDTVQSWEPVPF
ncbi:uncharacterized protein LACBIDRAFT_306291 [Laccaria bicolor S238N-H82]|uniref:Predicted protein n=1 Tax=Laccaria bicolor (strain S238N-H82 / ATCC MYA-4686) TaxID=486041 RepID=B0DN17_LACBS|nr:uncharacterized protein LACBIDRAFT_306291 [Laccaria bicolor S238N-H82]EDR03975.1 predicted protein [Laccaria bicolor S238N-H82]|eukprot:XP_001885230.1 predicted protein [Laccaria bicolor S238N-H82]